MADRNNSNVGFLIRFCSHSDIYRKYMNGEFSAPGSLVSSLVTVKALNMKQENLSFDANEDKYLIQTRDGSEIQIFSTGCKLFKGDKKGTFRCANCNKKHQLSRAGNTPVITKLKVTYKIVRENDQIVRKRFIDCEGDKLCCDFNCAVRVAKRDYKPSAEQSIRTLHRIMYPNAGHLHESLDPDILIENGGSMSYEAFKADRSEVYVPLIGVTVNFTKRSIAAI